MESFLLDRIKELNKIKDRGTTHIAFPTVGKLFSVDKLLEILNKNLNECSSSKSN